MNSKRAKEICKEYEFTMHYQRIHDPSWNIENPKNGYGHMMPNKFFKELSESDFIKYMEQMKNPK